MSPGFVATAVLVGVMIIPAPATGQSADPYQPWGRVLAKYVNDRGEVDFRAVAREDADLDSFLRYVSRVSPRFAPEGFPSKEAKLAYYVNAYNALSMFNVIESGFPKSLGTVQRFLFFGVSRFSVGGERISLYALENDVIRPLGDERVHFVLNYMSVSCPRLPREPFYPKRLNGMLEAAAQEFFAEPRNLEILPELKMVRVSSILKFYREDFLKKSPTLLAYINRYSKQPIPDDYGIEYIDYDWTVNDQHRERRASESR